MSYMDDVLSWALKYASMGWSVLPLHSIVSGKCTCGKPDCEDAGKHPITTRGVKDGSKEREVIEAWFGKGTGVRNVGICTGEQSGITILDIDIGEGKMGAASWAEATREHGEPVTLTATTGSGGSHVVFQYNSALKTASNVLGKGVDCRNDRGYIVAAPSKHRSGGVYAWDNWGTALAPLPGHLSVRKEMRGRPRKDDPLRRKYGLTEVKDMLASVPADDRDLWRNVGIILGREFARSEEAWALYVLWADGWGGKKGRNHDAIMNEAFYKLSQAQSEKELTIGTIVKAAIDHGWVPKKGDVLKEDLLYVVPANSFLDRTTSAYWVKAAVDAVVSPVNEGGKVVNASTWIQEHAIVTSLACDPLLRGDYFAGADYIDGALVSRTGRACFNQYRPATTSLGDAAAAGPFVEHVMRLMNKPGDGDQFLNYMAHLVQRPGVKPRFALLLAGPMGNGKDTALSMCYPAIGHHNVAPIEPKALDGGFNEYEAATLVVLSECADPQEMSKWAFNEKTKVLIAGNPDHTTINKKYGAKYSIRRYCGVVITTNHLASGIYIPQGDRRYDVIETATFAEMGLTNDATRRAYFETLYEWFLKGGDRHVAAFLHERDVSGFSPDHGQRKTAAHHEVVAVNLEADGWLNDILFEMGDPPVVRADWIETKAVAAGHKDMEVRRKLGPAMVRSGYAKYRNPARPDGRWYRGKKGVTVYVKAGALVPQGEAFETVLSGTPL